jgi:dTDP-4-dehydrorhamnose reductase
MKVLITGANGNMGGRLLREMSARGDDAHGIDVDSLNITDFDTVMDHVATLRPELVIHCAALTNVDKCALEPDLALTVNGIGTQNVALACQRVGAAMCYLSTNEVFDGQRGTPYLEYDVTHPINPYGYSKWFGEQAIRDLLPQHYIVRTSWIFAHGGVNFLQKIMERAASGQSLSVVVNEIGSPTYGEDLVAALLQLIGTGRYGIYHLTNEGYTSRYEFARYILDCYGYSDVPITKALNVQYPRPSRPPVYGALRNTIAAHMGIKLRDWREAVAAFVARERELVPQK